MHYYARKLRRRRPYLVLLLALVVAVGLAFAMITATAGPLPGHSSVGHHIVTFERRT